MVVELNPNESDLENGFDNTVCCLRDTRAGLGDTHADHRRIDRAGLAAFVEMSGTR